MIMNTSRPIIIIKVTASSLVVPLEISNYISYMRFILIQENLGPTSKVTDVAVLFQTDLKIS